MEEEVVACFNTTFLIYRGGVHDRIRRRDPQDELFVDCTASLERDSYTHTKRHEALAAALLILDAHVALEENTDRQSTVKLAEGAAQFEKTRCALATGQQLQKAATMGASVRE